MWRIFESAFIWVATPNSTCRTLCIRYSELIFGPWGLEVAHATPTLGAFCGARGSGVVAALRTGVVFFLVRRSALAKINSQSTFYSREVVACSGSHPVSTNNSGIPIGRDLGLKTRNSWGVGSGPPGKVDDSRLGHPEVHLVR